MEDVLKKNDPQNQKQDQQRANPYFFISISFIMLHGQIDCVILWIRRTMYFL